MLLLQELQPLLEWSGLVALPRFAGGKVWLSVLVEWREISRAGSEEVDFFAAQFAGPGADGADGDEFFDAREKVGADFVFCLVV
ncbi:MAG: hypothetical protein JO051_04760 [Acidobacteriaceae bacterium]|nr:hypothetical protein [Acidobacteriaceae bacterium]